jgi:hypothetical protein
MCHSRLTFFFFIGMWAHCLRSCSTFSTMFTFLHHNY